MSVLNTIVCDCTHINNFMHRSEHDRIILQGEDFCSILNKCKGIDYIVDNKIVNILIDVNKLVSYAYSKRKVTNIMQTVYNYQLKSSDECFWSTVTSDIKSDNHYLMATYDYLKEIETENKKKMITMLLNNTVSLLDDNYYSIDDDLFYDTLQSKTVKHKQKLFGGIIWEKNNSFITMLEKDSTDVMAYIINDDLFKNKNISNITFASIGDFKSINKNGLINKRLIIYHPCDQMMNTILDTIFTKKISCPLSIWIVISQRSTIKPSFDQIVKCLVWNKTSSSNQCQNKIPIVLSGKHNTHDKMEKKSPVTIERVKYSLSKCETQIMNTIHVDGGLSDNLLFLEQISHKKTLPHLIYDSAICVICQNKFTESTFKAYTPCGHVMCAECIACIFMHKNACPICRHTIVTKNIVIPKMVSSKFTKLFDLLDQIDQKDENIIIYVDNKDTIIQYSTHLNQTSDHKICNITNKKPTKDLVSTIIFTQPKYYTSMQNIKNVKHVIITTSSYEYIINSSALGYDYAMEKQDIKLWIIELSLPNNKTI